MLKWGFLVSMTLSVTAAAAPVQQLWEKRFNGPASREDVFSALTVDANGQVYVTGSSDNNVNPDPYGTVKYDTNGNQLWVARYTGPRAIDVPLTVIVDGAGYVYVTGFSHGEASSYDPDYATIKYAPEGTELWVARYNGAGTNSQSPDNPMGMVVNAAGEVYVTGTSMSPEQTLDFATIKYNTNGTVLWIARYNGAAGYADRASAIGLDAAGNVYVCGATQRENYRERVTLLKYSAAGTLLWERHLETEEDGGDLRPQMKVDPSGNAHLAFATTRGTPEDVQRIVALRYNAAGEVVWRTQHRLFRANYWPDVVAADLDDGGNLCVAIKAGGIAYHDYLVWKISPEGQSLWTSRYNSPANYQDVPGGMALDAQGNIYVTGTTYLDGNRYQFTTIKLRPSGQREWETTTTHPDNFGLSLSGVKVDAAGHVYAGGSTGPVGTKDYVTIKYRQLPQPGLPEITAHPENQTTTVGGSAVFAVTATGEGLSYQWHRDGSVIPNATNSSLAFNDIGSAMRGYYYVDVRNDAGVVASTEALLNVIIPPQITEQPLSRQVIAGSSAEFSVTVTGSEPLSFQWFKGGMAIDGATNAVLSLTNVQASETGAYQVIVTNAAGSAASEEAILSLVPGLEQLFVGSFREQGHGYSFPQFMRLSSDGKAHLAQTLHLPTRSEFLTVQFDTNGAVLWTARHAGAANEVNLNVTALEIDSSNNVYVAGNSINNSERRISVVKYSPAGAQQWALLHGAIRTNAYDEVTAMAVDSSGNVYVTGSTEGSPPQHHRDFLTIKFNAEGVEQWAVPYSLSESSADYASAIQVDATGVYVVGTSYHETIKLVTLKYNHTGALLWARTHDGGYDARAIAVKLDSAGDVVVSGAGTHDEGDSDLITIKYSPAGDLMWLAHRAGMLEAYDYPYAMDLDGQGNIWVVGVSSLPHEDDTSLSAFTIVKYDREGNELWEASQVASASTGGPDSFRVDAAGNAYLLLGKFHPDSGSDLVTSKYDTNGVRLWEAVSTRERYGDEYPGALALTADGDLLVSGISYSPVSELVLFRYRQSEIVGLPVITQSPRSRDAVQGASVTFGVTALGDGLSYQWYFNGRRIDGATGSTYVIASADERHSGHYAAEVRNAAGAVVSATAILSIGVPPTIVRQPQGQSVLPGTDVALRVLASGSRPLSYQWRRNGTNILGALGSELELLNVQPEESGLYSVVVSNRAGTVTSVEVLLTVTRHARRDWISLFSEGPPATTVALDMELDGSTNVYVAGHWWGEAPSGYLTAKFSSTGEQLWARKFAPGNFNSTASALEVDAAGNVYTVGSAVVSNGVRAVATVKYDPNGNELWVRHFAGPSMPLEADITISAAGSIYVAGKFNVGPAASVLTVKYDTNGAQLWSASQSLDRYIVGACKVAADSQDNVYVMAGSGGQSSGNDVMTIKYNANGARAWTRTISDQGDQDAVDIKIDAGGDVVMLASSRHFSNRGFLTVKYRSTDGEEVWRRSFSYSGHGVDGPRAVEVDSARNIYVTGKAIVRSGYDEYGYYREDEDVLTIKYNPDGQLMWVATYGAQPGSADVGTSIAWDGDRGIYITGTSSGEQGGGNDWLTLRYDVDGNRYWADIYRSPDGGHDNGLVARARFGTAYVLGSTGRGDYGFERLGLIKYTDTGLAEAPRIDTAPQGQTAVAGNNVLLSVVASGPGPLRYQWYYDGRPIPGANSSGLLLPRVETANEGSYFVEVSNDAGVVSSAEARLEVVIPARITLSPRDHCIVAGSRAQFVVDYEGDGTVAVRWYHNGAPLASTGHIVTITNAHLTNAGVYSVVVSNAYGVATASARLIITPQATLAWSARFNSTNEVHDEPHAAVVDRQGNTYMIGNRGAASVTVKFDSSGALAWQRWNVRTGYLSFAATDLALAPDEGSVYVTGWAQGPLETEHAMTMVKYAANGDQLWATNYAREDHARPVDMKVDAGGHVVVTAEGGSDRYIPGEILTTRFDSDGTVLWTRRFDWSPDTPDAPTALALDAAGNVYITGYTSEMDPIEYERVANYVTLKYNAAGDHLWTAEHSGPGGADDRPSAIAVDEQGSVYVTGRHSHEYWVNSGTTVYFDYDYATIKYDTNGQRLWLAVYGSGPRQIDEAVDLKVDGAGNVYVVGQSDHDIVTVKYDAQGRQQWVSRLDSGYSYDAATRVILDDAGNLYATGFSGDYGDILTFKLDPNGSRIWLARFDGASGRSSHFDYPISIGLDTAGDVYVAGSVESPATGRDFAVLRYSMAMASGSPVITSPPQSIDVVPGAAAMLSVTATGNAPLRYQWWRDGVALTPQTNSVLEIAGVTFADAGQYYVSVYNDVDCTVSAEATLSVAASETVQYLHVEQTGNATRLVIAGPLACTFRVECSADMISWHTLGTVYNSTGTCEYFDATPAGPRRFYRVLKLP